MGEDRGRSDTTPTGNEALCVETLRKATSLQRVNALAFLAQPNCNLENRTTKVPMSVIGARDVRVGHQLLQPSPTLNSFY